MNNFFCEFLIRCIVLLEPLSAYDLHNGVALYHYNNGDYHEAFLETLVYEPKIANEKSELNHYFLSAQVHYALKLDLHKYALNRFNQFTTENRKRHSKFEEQIVFDIMAYLFKNKKWIELSQLVEEHLPKTRRTFRTSHQLAGDEAQYFQAMLALYQENYANAEKLTRRIKQTSPWKLYAHTNLALAYLHKGQKEHTKKHLDQILGSKLKGSSKASISEEYAYIKDKAALLKVHMLFEEGKGKEAESVINTHLFSKDSIFYEDTLSTYAEYLSIFKDYENSLKLWKWLQNSTDFTASSLAYIAIPELLESQKKTYEALENFNIAREYFEKEITDFNQFSRSLLKERYLNHLLHSIDNGTLNPSIRENKNRELLITWLTSPNNYRSIQQWQNTNKLSDSIKRLTSKINILYTLKATPSSSFSTDKERILFLNDKISFHKKILACIEHDQEKISARCHEKMRNISRQLHDNKYANIENKHKLDTLRQNIITMDSKIENLQKLQQIRFAKRLKIALRERKEFLTEQWLQAQAGAIRVSETLLVGK